MNRFIYLLLTTLILGACSGDKMLKRIGNNFAIVKSESCVCPSLITYVGGGNHLILLKDVSSVWGSEDMFIIEKGERYKYYLVKNKTPFYREDLVQIFDLSLYQDSIEVDFDIRF